MAKSDTTKQPTNQSPTENIANILGLPSPQTVGQTSGGINPASLSPQAQALYSIYGVSSPTYGSTLPTQQQQQQSPLAANAYFQSIAPLLSQIQQRQDSRNQQFFGAMNNFLGQVQLPPGIRELLQSGFANSQRDIQNINDTNAAAALTSPGLDALMKQVQAAQTYAKQAYFEELAAKAAGGVTPTSGQPSTVQPAINANGTITLH